MVLYVARPYLILVSNQLIVNYKCLPTKCKKCVQCNSELKTNLLSANFIILGSGGFLPRNFWRIWPEGTLAHYNFSAT